MDAVVMPAPAIPFGYSTGGESMCPDRFYVTIKRGEQTGFLLGPYETHAEALANVDRARQLAHDVDPFSHFDAFGTTSSKMLIPTVFRGR